MTYFLIRRERDMKDVPTQWKLRENISKRQQYASHGERPQEQTADTLILDIQASKLEKINFYCLSHLVMVFCYGSTSKLT